MTPADSQKAIKTFLMGNTAIQPVMSSLSTGRKNKILSLPESGLSDKNQ
jgi:hypothetical protein